MLIAFIGVDGSGKTTLANRTARFLKKKGYKIRVIKPFEYLFLKNITKKKDSKKILARKQKPFYYKFWSFFALIDNWFYYLLKIKPLLKKYDFVICDRYFYDFVTSFDYFGFSFKWFSKIYSKLIPKPGLLFVLSINPKQAFKRERGEKHKMNFYRIMVNKYKSLSKRIGGCFIDNSKKNGFLKIKKILGDYLEKS